MLSVALLDSGFFLLKTVTLMDKYFADLRFGKTVSQSLSGFRRGRKKQKASSQLWVDDLNGPLI